MRAPNYELIIKDTNPQVVAAYKQALYPLNPSIRCEIGDILQTPKGTSLVSPANTKGNMDGGIDRVYAEYFGEELVSRVQKFINQNYAGKLPIGQAQIIPTNNQTHPYLVLAPTVTLPGHPSSPKNIYLATKALLTETALFNKQSKPQQRIHKLATPGLGTQWGGVAAHESARAFAQAYKDANKGLENIIR